LFWFFMPISISAPQPQSPSSRYILFPLFLAVAMLSALSGCSTQKYTVDDGRKVDEVLLQSMRHYGAGERSLRPAIVRSASLKDTACDVQWELPIAVATSYGWNETERVAWVRALGVDERLTVTGAHPTAPLQIGDKLVEIAGFKTDNAEKMTLALAERRDEGKPFDVKTLAGKTARLEPFKGCRGYARFAPPSTPNAQDYHWLLSLHPIEVSAAGLTDDEALWTVLWSQGLSEEGGARMKTYHYGVKIIGTLYDIATIASGLKGAALAAEAAVVAAKSAAAAAATEILKRQLLEQAQAIAQRRIRDSVGEVAKQLTQKQVVGAMQMAAAHRTSLSGVARVAATVFDRADTWAYTRMQTLKADPFAGARLHQKLIENGATSNAMVFDPDRMQSLDKLVQSQGRGDELVAALKGIRPTALVVEDDDMPLASKPVAFSFDDASEVASTLPFARGLIDGMLDLPVESKKSR
jgi:hypothetical protein